ncbi:MAG: hypothetical protein IT436_16725 [Phycisphaerales bacterium]|nr:hypothetical protein [Phycisphaerales bacterium]
MLTTLAADGEVVVVVMATIGGIIAIVAIITSSIEKIKIARAKEESRREIAAYIAEGSIPPDEGRRLLEAGGSLADKVRDAVASRIS